MRVDRILAHMLR